MQYYITFMYEHCQAIKSTLHSSGLVGCAGVVYVDNPFTTSCVIVTWPLLASHQSAQLRYKWLVTVVQVYRPVAMETVL